MSTSWTDFETVAHHAGSSDDGYALIDEEFSIEVDLGEGVRFYLPLDADGNMELPCLLETLDSRVSSQQLKEN